MRTPSIAVLGILSLFALSSCRESNDRVLEDNVLQFYGEGRVHLEKRLVELLSEFGRDDRSDSCVYELYVQKQTTHEIVFVLLRLQNDHRSHKVSPLFYVECGGHRFLTYAGLEECVEPRLKGSDSALVGVTGHCPWKAATYVDSAGVIRKLGDFGFPFVPTHLEWTPGRPVPIDSAYTTEVHP